MLPPEAIMEFKQIYEREERVLLSNEEAVILANNLMGLFQKVSLDKPDQKGNNETRGI